MPDNYARLTNAPRRLTLGGEAVYVRKLTPRGLGDLQALFMAYLESPLERAKREIADTNLSDDESRAIWTRAVMETRESWPPSLDSTEALNALSTDEGRVTLIWVATRRHPNQSRREAERLAAQATVAEIGELLSAIMPGELGDFRDPDSTGEGVPYSEVRHSLVAEFKGWTYEMVDNMTFENLRLVVAEGKATAGMKIESEAQAVEQARRWREYYVGL